MRRSLWIAVLILGLSTIVCNAQLDTVRSLEKVEVRAKRTTYKKRGNAAVDLARELIKNKERNNPAAHYKDIQYQRYERIEIAIDNFKSVDTTKKLAFLNNHIVINPNTGKPVLPILLKERVVQTSINGKDKKEVELLNESKGLDEKFSQESVMAFLQTALPETDLFADVIHLVQRQFVGPLNRSATDFYKFYLGKDTIAIDGAKYITLSFFPYAKAAMGFSGSITVSADSSRFIRSVNISIPNDADVNWLKNVTLTQHFVRDSMGYRQLVGDVFECDFSITNATNALAVKRDNRFSLYNFDASPSAPYNIAPIRVDSVQNSKKDEQLGRIATGMRSSTLYSIGETILMLIAEGYIGTSRNSYFDIGPVATFLTGNPLEGTRLTLGGMTTANLSKRFFVEGRVSYGTKDQVWKYMGAVEWSFNDKKNHLREFPIHSLRAIVSYDTHRFGESFTQAASQNIFSWAKRLPDSALTYVQRYELQYTHELKSHLSFVVAARHYTEKQSAVMQFAPQRSTLPQFTMSELQFNVRYSPKEKIYQTRFRRQNLQKYSFTVDFDYTLGIPHFLGSTFRRNSTHIALTSRLGVQPFGFFDIDIRAGAEWSRVPYMLLPHPNTDPSYITANNNAFSFMNPLEFLYDRYAFWGITYHLDGLILSRIPLINKLKLREVITFKGVWGYLSNQNNPALNPSLIPFPAGSSKIGHEPYMELGVGIENIFSLLRIDYVWRITYLDNRATVRGGLMLNLSVKF